MIGLIMVLKVALGCCMRYTSCLYTACYGMSDWFGVLGRGLVCRVEWKWRDLAQYAVLMWCMVMLCGLLWDGVVWNCVA